MRSVRKQGVLVHSSLRLTSQQAQCSQWTHILTSVSWLGMAWRSKGRLGVWAFEGHVNDCSVGLCCLHNLRPSRALPAEQKFSNDKLRAGHLAASSDLSHGMLSLLQTEAETEDPFAKATMMPRQLVRCVQCQRIPHVPSSV